MIEIELCYRPPLDWNSMLRFMAPRAIPGVEAIAADCYRRTIAVDGAPAIIDVAHVAPRLVLRMRSANLVGEAKKSGRDARRQCAQHGLYLSGREVPDGTDESNRSRTARRSREAKLKEAAGKLSTAGTRTGSEAGCGRRAGWQQRSPKLIKSHQVEPGGARGKMQHLTWGELRSENSGAVSRGRSSEEGR